MGDHPDIWLSSQNSHLGLHIEGMNLPSTTWTEIHSVKTTLFIYKGSDLELTYTLKFTVPSTSFGKSILPVAFHRRSKFASFSYDLM